MNSLENWIRWHSLNETLALNALSESCYDFSDNAVNSSDVSEDSCVKCVAWLASNKHLVGS
jgi:hypothetical protein